MDKSVIFDIMQTKLSAIRTLLTYIILSLVSMIIGIIFIKLDAGLVSGGAIAMFVFSCLFFVIGVFVYYLTICRIKKIVGGRIINLGGKKDIEITTNI